MAVAQRFAQSSAHLFGLDGCIPWNIDTNRFLVAAHRHIEPALAEGPVDKAEHAPRHTVANGRFLHAAARRRHNKHPPARAKQALQHLLAVLEERLKLVTAMANHRLRLRCQHMRQHVGRSRDEEALRWLHILCHTEWLLTMFYIAQHIAQHAQRAQKCALAIVPLSETRAQLAPRVATFQNTFQTSPP